MAHDNKKDVRKESYKSPEVISYNSKQLLELLGPAQGYSPSPGGGTGDPF